MQIIINISKAHLYAFVIVTLILTAALVAIGVAPQGVATHETLFTDSIKAKSTNMVQVNNDITVTGLLRATEIGGLQSSFRIIRAVDLDGSYPGTSQTTSCPAGYTIAFWAVDSHTDLSATGGSGYQYCTCSANGNGVLAQYLSAGASNPNLACGCAGLCVRA